MKNVAKLTAGLVAAWFVLALSASAAHLFSNPSQRIGIAVALAAAGPVLIFLLALALSRTFHRFVLSLNVRALTWVHSWRILGITFVLLEARGALPAIFALPAGYGDMAIGITAGLVASKLAIPRHRNAFIAWQLLGMADLLMAVGLGTTARLLSPNGATMALMTVLPLSLVPTFLVPLLMMLHVIAIDQASRWKNVPLSQFGSNAPAAPRPSHAAGDVGNGLST